MASDCIGLFFQHRACTIHSKMNPLTLKIDSHSIFNIAASEDRARRYRHVILCSGQGHLQMQDGCLLKSDHVLTSPQGNKWVPHWRSLNSSMLLRRMPASRLLCRGIVRSSYTGAWFQSGDVTPNPRLRMLHLLLYDDYRMCLQRELSVDLPEHLCLLIPAYRIACFLQRNGYLEYECFTVS